MLCYIAYPTSLTLQSANALQTYATLRELRARCPDMLAIIPRWGREATRFSEVGAWHIPRPAIGKLSRLYRSTLLYYLEHTAFAWMCAAVLNQYRRHTNIEAVYIRQIVCAAWWSAVIGPRLGLPVIYEAHDLESRNPSRAKEPWAQGILHMMDRTALTHSNAVVSLTVDFQRYLTHIGWRQPDDVFVIPDAYDEYTFIPQNRQHCRAMLKLSDDATIIVYAGMTFAHRWLEGLLAAVTHLGVHQPQLHLILVGGRTAEIATLRRQALELGLFVADADSEHTAEQPMSHYSARLNQPSVTLVGARPQSAVLPYLGAADVLVIPDTVTDMTASPLKLFEYLALGQQLVLPDLPALHEIVPPSIAHYFPRRNLDGLTQALMAALAAKDDQASATTRRSIARDHTYGRRAERILDVTAHVQTQTRHPYHPIRIIPSRVKS